MLTLVKRKMAGLAWRIRSSATGRAGDAKASKGAGCEPQDEDADDAEFRRFVSSALTPEIYLATNPDVRSAGADPITHWLEHGIYEGRKLAPEWNHRYGAAAAQPRASDVRRFIWRGQPVALRPPLPASLAHQIQEQGRHEPAVFAPGALAIANLRIVESTDLINRGGVNVERLFGAVPTRPHTVMIIPHLVVGGAEKYAADLIDVLASSGGAPALIIVTIQSEQAAEGWRDLSILAPFRDIPVVFWRDVSRYTQERPQPMEIVVFARFLNALRPKTIIVNNSWLGLECIATHGRGLSLNARIVCTYFSMGVLGLGAPFGTRFPRRTLPFAMALTDNVPMAQTLERLYSDQLGRCIAVLPARIPLENHDRYHDRLLRRRQRTAPVPRSGRWVWVSRVEPFKGTKILSELATLRMTDRFDVFGPLADTLDNLGLSGPNIHYRGTVKDIADYDFADYDGFIFTSLYEGMPNIVLEMSQHAIPMVLTDVGGLRDTFDDRGAIFISHRASTAETAGAFGAALGRIIEMSPEETVTMVETARNQVAARHAPDQFLRRVTELFGI